MKMHTLLDLRGNIPSFIHISDGKLHDVHALDMIVPEAGAIYVMDRGYLDFARLYGLHEAGAFFVTRAKSNSMHAGFIPPRPIARPALSLTRRSLWTGITQGETTRRIFAVFVSAIPKPGKPSCF